MKYILSTMTMSVSYASFTHAGDLPVLREKITIKGGANLPSTKSGFGEQTNDEDGIPIWTASGFVTPISDEKYDRLKDHKLFKQHLEKGLVKVINHDITGDHRAVKKLVVGMVQRDDFAQLTPATIGLHTKVKVSTKSIDADVQFQ